MPCDVDYNFISCAANHFLEAVHVMSRAGGEGEKQKEGRKKDREERRRRGREGMKQKERGEG